MSLRYACIIIDHDDTAVDSTSVIHYPAHVEVMRRLRPDLVPVDLDNWFRKNFHPGIMEFLKNELHFTDEEIELEYTVWRDFTQNRVPEFFPGFMDFLKEYRRLGGLIAVVSHSEVDIIRRHYEVCNGEPVFLPDRIYGWTRDEARRKPHPYPVEQILKTFKLKNSEVLVVDDLKPGVMMAKAAKVPVAAAGWAHRIPEIQDYMKSQCDLYLERVEDLAGHVLG